MSIAHRTKVAGGHVEQERVHGGGQHVDRAAGPGVHHPQAHHAHADRAWAGPPIVIAL